MSRSPGPERMLDPLSRPCGRVRGPPAPEQGVPSCPPSQHPDPLAAASVPAQVSKTRKLVSEFSGPG